MAGQRDSDRQRGREAGAAGDGDGGLQTGLIDNLNLKLSPLLFPGTRDDPVGKIKGEDKTLNYRFTTSLTQINEIKTLKVFKNLHLYSHSEEKSIRLLSAE